MILTEMNQYDLTGLRPEFKRIKRFCIFTGKQCIELSEAAYGDASFKLYRVNDDGSRGAAISKTDSTYGWSYSGSYAESCNDMTAKSEGLVRFKNAPYQQTADTVYSLTKTYYVYDPIEETFTAHPVSAEQEGQNIELTLFEKINSWNPTIVNKFYMTKTTAPAASYLVEVEYQALRRDAASLERDDIGPSYSPGLMRSVIRKLDEILATRYSAVDVFAESGTTQFVSLEEDLTGAAPANYVQNEKHTISVTENKYVVRPYAGSYYRHDLTIDYIPSGGGSSVRLVEETGTGTGDYEVVGVNRPKTSISMPSSGVYDFIVFKKALTGQVYITYHAFGGEISIADLISMQDMMFSLLESLSSKNLLTTATLNQAAIIQHIVDRLDSIEHSLQHYKAERFIMRSHEVDKWVNVAYVTSNPWSSNIGPDTQDLGHFSIDIDEFDISLDIVLHYNASVSHDIVSNISINPTRIGMSCPVYDDCKADVGLNYYKYITQRATIKFRILTGATADNEHYLFSNGLVLQMAVVSYNERDCHVTITEKTSAKSPWMLIADTNSSARQDYFDSDYVVFPGASSAVYWDPSAGCVTSNKVVVPEYPYTVFVGSIPMGVMDGKAQFSQPMSYLYGADYAVPEGHEDTDVLSVPFKLALDVTKSDIEFGKLSGVRIHVYDRYTCKDIVCDISDLSVDEAGTTMKATAFYFKDDLCYLDCVFKLTNNVYTAELVAYTGTNSYENDRFVLSRIDFI